MYAFNLKTVHSLILPIAISSCVLGLFFYDVNHTAIAQSAQPLAIRFRPSKLSRQSQIRLAKRGAPRKRSAAGTRGDCPTLKENMQATALIPLIQPEDKAEAPIALGLTSEARPTFWFYIPFDRKQLSRLQFTLLNESENSVVEPINLPLESTPGIVGIQLPESAPALVVGQYYQWYILMDCTPQGITDIFVDAMVQRVELPSSLMQQIQQATPRERIRLYAENGLWQDAFTQMQALRRQTPKDTQLEQDWRNLLESIDLVQMAEK